MPSTRSRPGGREQARPASGGVAADHAATIYWTAGTGIAVVVAFLALTSTGRVIDAATQHFMLFYAGVFALLALCASVGLGLVATDRRFLGPGQRVLVQSAHRAASFGAVTFLVVHIVTEILAQRVHAIDAVVPFLSPFRTFYLGLGTIAADLVILLVITGIVRGRFNASGRAWRWRAIHYTSYAALVFGVWHGLLAGRPARPYVDWSYGFVIAFVALGVAVRALANAQKPKESLSAAPVPEASAAASAPLRAAALAAQLAASRGGLLAGRGPATGSQPARPALLGAPVLTATALPAGGPPAGPGQPYYEPGYDGPPRYLGAPRPAATGPLPHPSGPLPQVTGPLAAGLGTGPLLPHPSGPLPQVTGPLTTAFPVPPPPPPGGPYSGARHPSGPLPQAATGSFLAGATELFPRGVTGPVPPAPASGPVEPSWTGPQARIDPWAASDPRWWPAPSEGFVPPGAEGRPGWSAREKAAPASSWPYGSSEPPWGAEFPGTDPGLRYREPGPGMPGYRGSRDHRYGGDRRW